MALHPLVRQLAFAPAAALSLLGACAMSMPPSAVAEMPPIPVTEGSAVTPDGPLVWPFKFFIPIAAALMLLQGFTEMIRAVQALRTGVWPDRLSDVEETETRLARESQM